MDKIIVEGGCNLNGDIIVAGSKNASLPIIAASILCKEEINLINIPHIQDSVYMLHLITCMGAKLKLEAPINNGYSFPVKSVKINCEGIEKTKVDYEIVRKMRASIIVLGSLLARFGSAEISLPGGCIIGARPVNLHIDGLKALGASVEIDGGYIKAKAENGKLRGGIVNFPMVSVGATQNVMMVATLAEGITTINNAAREPEVVALGQFLQKMGAKITGLGSSTMVIEGVESLHSASYIIPPDRIEAATYAVIAAATKGKIVMHNTNIELFKEFKTVFDNVGVSLSQTQPDQVLAERSPNGLNACSLETDVYPGFPTDMQAQMMALLLNANGISEISENIFENRFMHVPELMRMGAKIEMTHNKASVYGPAKLKGTDVMASDLRASVALIIAALNAEGATTINRVYHLDRGYDFLSGKLKMCGANIIRTKG